jgi:DNA-binding PadR family transcriptional regulator
MPAMGKGTSRGPGFLGEFEHMVLLAILQTGTNAYAVRILGELDGRAGRRTDRGALYKTLDRLEAKGFLGWAVEPGTPARGGHRRRVFSVRPEGLEALRVSREALNNLSEGLGSLLSRPAK